MTYARPKKKRPPFVIAYKAVLRLANLSLEAKAVLLILKSYANSDGTHCFPSLDKLAADAGCSHRTIRRYLAELKKRGLIHSEQRQTGKGKFSSITFLLYDDLRAKASYAPKARTGIGRRVRSQMADGEAAKIVPFTEENEAAV